MWSSIINKYINHLSHDELLSLSKFGSFYNIKKVKHHNVANPNLLGL